MKRTSRGLRFPLGRKMVKLWKWVLLKPKQSTRGYSRLNPQVSGSARNKMMTKICNWGRCLRRRLCPAVSNDSSLDRKAVVVPKGHLAVYVGEKEADTHRYLVPVIYFNHPLFAELLREAEEEFGFDHSGGITIPCRVAEFESVRTRIAGERRLPLARRLHLS